MHPYPAPGAAPPPVPGCTWDRARAGARRGTNAGTVWALHARPGPEPGTSLVAYCGADGDVAVGGLPLASRYRLPHRPVAGAARRPRACAAGRASALMAGLSAGVQRSSLRRKRRPPGLPMPQSSSTQAARCGVKTALRGGPRRGGRRAARRRCRRRARPHRARPPAAGLRQRGDALAALSAEELAAQHGVYVGAPRVKVKPEKTAKTEAGAPPARAPEEQEALHRVRWSWQPAGAPRPEVRRARIRVGHRLARVARSCALLGGPVTQAGLQCARVCIVPRLTEARWRATCTHVRACASHLCGYARPKEPRRASPAWKARPADGAASAVDLHDGGRTHV